MVKQSIKIDGVMKMFDCSRGKALKIADEAGAKFKIGRSCRYDVDRLNEYMEKQLKPIEQ